MKFIIIISIFVIVFGLVGYYVYIRAMQAFAGTFLTSKIVLFSYIFLLSAFLLGKTVEYYSIGILSNTLIKIGSISLGIFLYFLFFIVFFDFLRGLNYFTNFFPSFITFDYQKTKFLFGIGTIVAVLVIFFVGFINAFSPKVKSLDIEINKNSSHFESLNIVAVSDIHLGTMVNKRKTNRLIKAINDLKPDLVLFAGDIIDDNINVVKYYNLLNSFKEIKSKYGVYSCLGNHEYISGAHKDLSVFQENGITMLKDTTIKVDDKFYIIGRDDVEGKSFNGGERKSLEELTKDVDFTLPVFLLDHQPFKLEKSAEHQIDLQFSGHTHNGQMWPFNYITGLLFEEDWGYLKKENTHFYISAGFGTSAMPICVGSYSEIVNIQVALVSPI